MKTFYRIVEVIDRKDNEPCRIKTLFHGINGSRFLPINKWITAKRKIVSDGGTRYISGFHVLPSRLLCEQYLRRFKCQKRRLQVIGVEVKGIRPKRHSRDQVFLADKMYVPLQNVPIF